MRYMFLLCLASLVFGGETSVPQAARQLDQVIAKRKPGDASELIGRLVARYEDASAHERAVALRSLGKAAASKDVTARHAAFRALAKLRVEGSGKYLKRWLTPPKKGAVHESYFKGIDAAGEIADPRSLTKLLKLTGHKNVEVAVASIRALGGYRTLPVPSRKKLAMDLIRKLEQLTSGGTRGWGRAAAQSTRKETEQTGTPLGQPSSGADAAERAGHMRHAIVRTLETVTGARCGSVPEWVSWRKRAKKIRDPFA